MKLTIEINELPKTPNSIGKASIWGSHKERHKWRHLLELWYTANIKAALRTDIPFKKANLVLTRCSAKEPDVDNLYASWKYVIDALKYIGLIEDDKPSNIDLRCKWERMPQKQGKIRIEIESIA